MVFKGSNFFVKILAIGLCGYIGFNPCIHADFLNFSLPQSIKKRFISIDFRSGGNNFRGGIFWYQTEDVDGEGKEIKINGQKLICTKQMRGIYYNTIRGAALRPLDQTTLKDFEAQGGNEYYKNNLDISNGLYTSCYSGSEKTEESYLKGGIYGQLSFEGGYTGKLTAGINYNFEQNSVDPEVSESLSYLTNSPVPIGYIYDSGGGGIGFVGGALGSGNAEIVGNHKKIVDKIDSGSGIRKIFGKEENNIKWKVDGDEGIVKEKEGILSNLLTKAVETLLNIGVEGNVLVGNGVLRKETRKELARNFGRNESGQGQKYTFSQSDSIYIGKIFNKANKKAYNLCRSGYEKVFTKKYNELNKVNCLSSDDDNILIDTSVEGGNGKVKTVIVKEGNNLVISGSLFNNNLDVFLQKGNLLINKTAGELVSINGAGSYDPSSGVTSGVILNGNFIVNGLVGGYNESLEGIGQFDHKLYLHGKMVSLSTIGKPQEPRKRMVRKRFTNSYTGYISFSNSFVWRCQSYGVGTDGVNCSDGNDKYNDNPLVFIRKPIKSRIVN